VRVFLISSGDELLLGTTRDTNFGDVALRLRDAGHELVGGATVGDDLDELSAAVVRASAVAEAVVITGGLGPTADDLTRAAVAAAAGVPLERDDTLVSMITEGCRGFGREPRANDLLQADLPAGASALANPLGSAPGFAVSVGGATVFALSGVPIEMRKMLEEEVLPRLGRGTAASVRRLRLYGLTEAALDRALAPVASDSELRVGVTASDGILTVSLRGDDDRIDAAATRVRGLLGPLVFGRDDEGLADAVVARLVALRGGIATAESCTAGLLGAAITDVPGASAVYPGGVVSYANEVKTRELGVPAELLATRGSVSPEVAGAMAEGVRERFGATVGVGITGIAGPDGGTVDKPVGLVYTAVATDRGVDIRRRIHPGDRDAIRRRSVAAALDHVRAALRKLRPR